MSGVDGLPVYRTGLLTDSAGNALVRIDYRTVVILFGGREKTAYAPESCFFSIDIKAWIAVSFCGFFCADLTVRRQNRDLRILHVPETEFRSADAGGDMVYIQENELSKDAVERDRIGRHQKNSHRFRDARCGAVALHSDDPVHEIKSGCNAAVKVAEHIGKDTTVGIHCVAGSLVGAIDAAVLIFDGAGNVFQSVRFHLAQADYGICFFYFMAEHEFFADLAVRKLNSFSSGKVTEQGTVFLRLCTQSGFPDSAVKACGRAGTVTVRELAEAVFAQTAQHCAEYRRMRGDGLIGCCIFQKIWLNQNVLLRRNELLQSTEQLQSLPNSGIHRFLAIIAAWQQDNFRFFHRILQQQKCRVPYRWSYDPTGKACTAEKQNAKNILIMPAARGKSKTFSDAF